ncbi:MAG: PaaI family thioesterase [Acidimicrobiia bacterium]
MKIPEHLIPKFRELYDQCYACGFANPLGLHLDGFHRISETEVGATFQSRPEHRGTVGTMHGGVVAAALDEICAWTAVLAADTMAITAKLELRFRKPVDVGAEYQLIGRLLEQSGSRLKIEGAMLDGSRTMADVKGLFLATDPVESLWPADADFIRG